MDTYDSFNRVFGRDQWDFPHGGHGNKYTKSGLHRGYDRDASYSKGSPEYVSPAKDRYYSDPIGDDIRPSNKYDERTVKKLVQVPVTRQVKVPTTVEKVVEATEVREIPVKRLKQMEEVKTIEEEYVDYEERQATRMKEVWVRQEVPETYTERVPVKKTRLVEVPYTTTKEVTEYERIEVPTTKVVEERGYRVDEVVEYETHEVEGKQKVEWVPRVVDEWTEERDIGVKEKRIVDRHIGKTIYPESDDFVRSIPRADTKYIQGERFSAPVEDDCTFHVAPSAWAQGRGDSHFGIYVKESVIGLVVKDVMGSSAAAEAGIQPGDVISSVDGVEVYSLEEWRRTIGRKAAVTVTYRSKRLGRNMKTQLTH